MMQIKAGHNATLSASDNITEYLPFEPRQSPIPIGTKVTKTLSGVEVIDGSLDVTLEIRGIEFTCLNTFISAFTSFSATSSVPVTLTWLDNERNYTEFNAYMHPLRPVDDYDALWRDQLQDVRIRFTLLGG